MLGAELAITHLGHKKPSYAISLNYAVLNIYKFQSGFTDTMFPRELIL